MTPNPLGTPQKEGRGGFRVGRRSSLPEIGMPNMGGPRARVQTADSTFKREKFQQAIMAPLGEEKKAVEREGMGAFKQALRRNIGPPRNTPLRDLGNRNRNPTLLPKNGVSVMRGGKKKMGVGSNFSMNGGDENMRPGSRPMTTVSTNAMRPRGNRFA